MKITDFGKNIYQTEVFFRANVIPLDFTRQAAEHFFAKGFSELGKEASSGNALITKGKGIKDDPFEQIKIGPDRLNLWVGWHYSFEKWAQLREAISLNLLKLLQNPSPKVVASVTTQVRITVPFGNIKRLPEIPQLQPLAGVYGSFVAEEFLGRLGMHNIFANEAGSKSIESQYYEDYNDSVSVFAFGARILVPDATIPFDQQLLENFALHDTSLAKFHDNIVLPAVKA